MTKLLLPLGDKILIKTLIAVALVIGALVLVTRQPAMAAHNCYGTTCLGLNPQSMGCGTDALSAWSFTFAGGNKVENRYSTHCNAEWERTTNLSGGSRYAAGTIRQVNYGCGAFCTVLNVRSPSAIANGLAVYTSMLGPDNTVPAIACGKLATTGPISVPVSSPCTPEA